MSVTPNFSWPLIEPTDYVTNLPADLETLADAIDATVDTIKDTADGAIAKSLVDAKGDLIAATADNTVARLAVGTNNHVLTADSATATGLKWAEPTVTIPPIWAIPTGQSYYVRSVGVTNAALVTNFELTEDVTYYTPVFLPQCTLDRIGLNRTTGVNSSGNTTRLGIYANSSANRPGNLILDAGTVNPTNASTNYEITISQALAKADIYWLAINRQATVGGGVDMAAMNELNALMNFDTAISSNTLSPRGYQETGITGAFANASSLTLLTTTIPLVFVRVA